MTATVGDLPAVRPEDSGPAQPYAVLRWLTVATFVVILNETLMVNAIPRLKDAVAAASGSTDGLQVSGELLVITNSDLNIRRMLDRRMDLRGDLGRLPRLVEAGVTDFVFTSDVFSDYAEAYDYFRNLVVNFRTAVGREVPPDV